jgi:Arc/MetJ-type ribon-helix-helix transcriptional regulator
MSKPTTNEFKIEQTNAKTYESLDEVVRAGAKKMLAAALEAEVAAYIQAHLKERDGKGHAL